MLHSTGSASLITSNDIITGNYNVSKQLEIRTSNGPLKIAVETGSTDHASYVDLETSNGYVTVQLIYTLLNDALRPLELTLSTLASVTAIVAKTDNARLSVDVRESPLNSKLGMQLQTSNGATDIHLPATYEGALDIASSAYLRPEISMEEQKDPLQRGRQRQLAKSSINYPPHVFVGNVYWNAAHRKYGNVIVRSMNSHVKLWL